LLQNKGVLITVSLQREPISNVMILIAVAISIYLFTFSQAVIVLFPALLIAISIGLQFYLKQRKIRNETCDDWSYEGSLTGKRLYKDTYYSIIGIAGMVATSLLVGYISYTGLGLSVSNSALFGIEMAIAEEMFFRGVIFNYLIDTLKISTIAMIASATIFMIYHAAVYGGSDTSLIYVFAGGFILSWITYKSGSLAAAMIAHSVNNVLAALGLLTVAGKIMAITLIPIPLHLLGVF
jgi:membrane protease YdiL (CAAX protease family)